MADIKRLHSFLGGMDSDAAARAIRAIQGGGTLLQEYPEAGISMMDETGRRELFVPFGTGAYVLRYLVSQDRTVVVVRVWHSRENRPMG